MRYTVEDIIRMPEGQTFDCKSFRVDPKTLAIAIVGMANADGGMIAVGISDKTREIEGVDNDEEHLNELLRCPFDYVAPTVSMVNEYLPCTDSSGRENHILLISIPASLLLHTNQADEAFWRVGDKTRKLQFEERVQLMYDKGERYYEDAPVFETPGKLPGIVRPDNIRHTHFSRNPKIAEYLKAYEYVKDFGEGVDRMCRELNALGSEGVHYHLVAFIMHATAYAAKLKETTQETTQKNQDNGNRLQTETRRITPVQQAILDYIRVNPTANREEIAAGVGNITPDGVKYNLATLQKRGLLKRIGPDNGGYWKIIKEETRNYPENYPEKGHKI